MGEISREDFITYLHQKKVVGHSLFQLLFCLKDPETAIGRHYFQSDLVSTTDTMTTTKVMVEELEFWNVICGMFCFADFSVMIVIIIVIDCAFDCDCNNSSFLFIAFYEENFPPMNDKSCKSELARQLKQHRSAEVIYFNNNTN